jgi:hypothetical protein
MELRIRPTLGRKEASAMAEPAPVFDVVTAGGGASGLALAAAIKQAMGQGASVAVVDPAAPAATNASPFAHGRDRRRAAPLARPYRRLGGD